MITVLGGSSQLTQCMRDQFNPECNIINSSDLDLRKISDIQTVLSRYSNKILINCAAFNNVEQAERDSDSQIINNYAVEEIAKFCNKNDIFLVHISTDFVFDGFQGNYKESDQTNPINAYGVSKLAGEKAVQSFAKKYVIIRTSWLYSHLETEHNFLQKLNKILQKNFQVVYGADDIIGSPTSCISLAEGIKIVLQNSDKVDSINRIFHFSDLGAVSRFEFVKEITLLINKKFNLKNSAQPVKNNFFKLVAPRPNNSSLDCNLFCNTFKYTPIDWKTSLSNTIKQL